MMGYKTQNNETECVKESVSDERSSDIVLTIAISSSILGTVVLLAIIRLLFKKFAQKRWLTTKDRPEETMSSIDYSSMSITGKYHHLHTDII